MIEITTADTDQAAMIRAIREHPDDDAPRLVYADWLEEHSQEERAEFIRVQCELAKGCRCFAPDGIAEDAVRCDWCNDKDKLHSREREMILEHGHKWCPDVLTRHYAEWHRGFLSTIRCPGDRLAAVVAAVCPDLWRVCERCSKGMVSRKYQGTSLSVGVPIDDCPTCHGTGRIAVPTEVWHMPVERIELSSYPEEWELRVPADEETAWIKNELNRHHPARQWSLVVDGQTIEPPVRTSHAPDTRATESTA